MATQVNRSALTIVLLSILAASQFSYVCRSYAQNYEQSAAYVSQVDEDLTIRRIAVLPVVDNVEGIYARHIESQLNSLVKDAHRWDFVESNIAGDLPSLSELEGSPEEIQKIGKVVDADAFIAAAASKGPNGMSIRLDLFLKQDGKLLAQEVLRDHPRFEIADLREQVRNLYKSLIDKIPYEGILLSRQQNRVTINLGKTDGLVKDQVITAVQIISVNRHPKFNFLISSEKEILGRIKILKVDDTLSFGAIISEKERGAIRRFAKVSGLRDVTYPAPDLSNKDGNSITDRPDSNVSFGNDPKEWVPVPPPSFGEVGVRLGFGTYSSNVSLENNNEFSAKSSFYPSLAVHGELWLTPQWTVRAELAQGVLSTDNPRPGSSPDTLNHLMSKYSLSMGYNFLLRDDFFGPKFFLSGGFGLYRMFVDNSQPLALTTVNYSGFLIGLGGSFPVTDEKIWYAGGRMSFYLFPRLSESPESSGGSSENRIVDFTMYVERKIAENLRAVGAIEFSQYGTSFDGAGSRSERGTSLSQKHQILSAGINYQF